ncbi:SIS domain-containing protein [bacterium]|nr:SIS domain-containing protein [bacterium]
MSSFQRLDDDRLKALGAYYTFTEIAGQPQLWLNTWSHINKHRKELSLFLQPLFETKDLKIILTGAGTSAFIGDVLEGVFRKSRGLNVLSAATTDIVTHPEEYLLPKAPTLLISFARSGDSPESISTVELANQICDNIYHLIITCNPDGILIQKGGNKKNSFVLIMPPESNDQSLAMTGSFTSMLLAGILVARYDEINNLREAVEIMAEYGNNILNNYSDILYETAKLDFNRAVFLGSGVFQGIARESHLKLQELTNGSVICKFDSFLGFRHGPKAVINNKTLLMYFISNNLYVQQYEKDLINGINAGQKGMFSIGVMEHDIKGIDLDMRIILSKDKTMLDQYFLAPVSVLPAQVIGYYKSLNLNFKPDLPSESGTITRVVQGVNVYPFKK